MQVRTCTHRAVAPRTWSSTQEQTHTRTHRAAAPQEVVELRHVLRQGVGRHRRQVRLHRLATGQPAVGSVDVALRRPADVRVSGLTGACTGAVQAYSRWQTL